MMRASRACHGVYRARWIILTFMLSLLTLCLLAQTSHRGARMLAWANDLTVQSPSVADKFAQQFRPQSTKKTKKDLHIVLPATKSSVHMCKTMLSMAILDYPKPHIVAWGDDSATKALIGGGSHYAKITRTLEYINDEKRRQKPSFDDELVFMLDAYDIWFQLPVEILIERYHNIVDEENERVRKRMGRAFDIEKIESSIIFGGGKRCAPNFIYSLACYPVPDSPISKDIRRQNTDTAMGRNQWSSFRTRYLNSGYIIGPIRKMRPLLEKAKQRLEECIDRKGVEWDDGYGGSNRCYGGSDQSIFVEMFGEQEFQREVMRRHHRRVYDSVLEKLIPDRAGANPPPTHIMNTPIEDLLDPAFSHQAHEAKYLENNPYEMGIAIDYWSLLGHQTSNAEDDARYIQYDEPIDEQIGRLNRFDCVPKTQFPPELASGQIPFPNKDANTWKTVPLYTEICVGSAPVMIHHNSIDKSQRERQWHKTWWHGQSRALFNQRNNSASAFLTGGFPTDSGETLSWNDLCPRDVEPELFRDVSKEQIEKEQNENEKKQKEEQELQRKQQEQQKQQQEQNAAQEQKGQKELAKE